MMPKRDGNWRPCGDYRLLSTVMTPNCYPVPHIQDFTQCLSGKTVFSQIDMLKGYYQVNMHHANIPKTAIITPFGLWEFVVMPFGMRKLERLKHLPVSTSITSCWLAWTMNGSHLDHLLAVLQLIFWDTLFPAQA